MAILNVKGKDYTANLTFKFREMAEKKYSKKTKDNEIDGFTNIYSNLLDKDVSYLSAFWDCALSQYKDRPSKEEIEEALIETAGEEQDYEKLLQDAFTALDNSGFFRERVKKFWKQTEIAKNFLDEEREQKAFEMELKTMLENREQLTIGKKK